MALPPIAYVAGASALIVASAVAWGFYWKSEAAQERVRVTSLTAERDSALGVVTTLQTTLKDNQKTTNTILKMNEKAMETTNEYRKQIMAADRKTAEANMALDKMQLTEHYEALTEPFQRGNAATDRVTSILCRAWGPWGDKDPRCRRPQDTPDASTDDREPDRSGTPPSKPPGVSDDN